MEGGEGGLWVNEERKGVKGRSEGGLEEQRKSTGEKKRVVERKAMRWMGEERRWSSIKRYVSDP